MEERSENESWKEMSTSDITELAELLLLQDFLRPEFEAAEWSCPLLM